MAASSFVPTSRLRLVGAVHGPHGSISSLGVSAEGDTPQLRLVAAPARQHRRLLGLIAAGLLVALVLLVAAGAASARSEVSEIAGHVVLQPGETLWDVAVRSAAPGVDPRRQMDALRRLNGFAPGPLDPWTVVLIPAR